MTTIVLPRARGLPNAKEAVAAFEAWLDGAHGETIPEFRKIRFEHARDRDPHLSDVCRRAEWLGVVRGHPRSNRYTNKERGAHRLLDWHRAIAERLSSRTLSFPAASIEAATAEHVRGLWQSIQLLCSRTATSTLAV